MSMLLINTTTQEEKYFDETTYNNGKYICPFHEDHNPSMSVNEEERIFNCFACGASGILRTEAENNEFKKQSEKNGKNPWKAIAPKKTIQKTKPKTPQVKSDDIDWEKPVREHVYKDINCNLIKKKIYFPFKNKSGKTPIQYRRENNKWVPGLTNGNDSKVPSILYNSNLFDDEYKKPLIICEGEKDCDNLLKHLKIIATTLGSCQEIISGIHKKYLINRKSIVISGDRDESGAEFVFKTVSALICMGYPIDGIWYLEFKNPRNLKGWDVSDALEEGVKNANLLDTFEVVSITSDTVKNELKKYELFIDDILSATYALSGHKNFPRKIFSDDIEQMLDLIAKSTSTSYSNTVHPYLSIISYLVCDKFYFQESTYKRYLTMHNILIGESGYSKSNCLKSVFMPKIDFINNVKHDQFKYAQNEYNKKLNYCKNNKQNDNELEEPKQSVATLDDITIPAVIKQFQKDKKIFMLCDEFASIIKGFDQFGKGGGNEQDNFMKLMDSETIMNSRVKDGILRIEQPLMPIYGNLQWGRVELLISKDKKLSGFAYRFLYSISDKEEYKRPLKRGDYAKAENAKEEFSKIFDAIYNLSANDSTSWDNVPKGMQCLKLSDEAYQRWDYFTAGYFNYLIKLFEKDGKNIAPILAKMRDHFSKLCCIIHIVNNYNNPQKLYSEIELDIIEKTERLVMYYINQAYRIFFEREIKENKNEDKNFIKIRNYMEKKELKEISKRTLQRYVFAKVRSDNIQKILESLEKQGYLKLETRGKSVIIKSLFKE